MKTLLIIIPGSEAKTPRFFRNIFRKIYNYFGVDRQGDTWAFSLKNHIEKRGLKIDVFIFDWSKGISRIFSINPAAKKLSQFLLKKTPNYDRIVLFGKSLGGIVAEHALKNSPQIRSKVHIIYVATPHGKAAVNLSCKVKITNIFSNEDIFFDLGLKLLYFGFGHKKLFDVYAKLILK